MKVLFNTSYKKNFKKTLKNTVFHQTDKIPLFLKNKLFKKIFTFTYKILYKRRSQQLTESIIGLRNYLYHLEKKRDLEINDLRSLIINNPLNVESKNNIVVETDYNVAEDSPDHLNPTGTKEDDTRCPAFATKINNFFGKKINYLDLGCSSGGLVYDFIERQNFGVGIEGSDFSKNAQRSFWKIIPNNLFTADITKKFEVKKDGKSVKFDCISSFEVMEHIETKDLDQVMKNVDYHLNENGIFLGSIGTAVSFSSNGVPLHLTVWEPEKWMEYLTKYFDVCNDIGFSFDEFPRGTGNGYMDPDFRTSPIGFHFFLKKKKNIN